jgi:hypothetical protein
MDRSTLHPLLTVLMLVAVCPAHAAAQTVVVQGENDDRRNRPIDMTFTKWITTFPLMEGYWGGDVANEFVGEVFQRQVSQRQADTCYCLRQIAAASFGSRRSMSSTTRTVHSPR